MQDREKNILFRLGLTEHESNYYLTLSRLGSSTVPALAQYVGVSRVAAYAIAKTLGDKGLIRRVPRGGKGQIEAAPPYTLLSFFEQKKREFQGLERSVLEMAEKLKKTSRAKSSRVRIRYFDGKNYIKNVFQDILDSVGPGEELLNFTSLDSLVHSIIKYQKHSQDPIEAFADARAERGIRLRALVEDTPFARKRITTEDNKKLLRDVKFIALGLSADIGIYGNKVEIALLDRNFFGFIVESEEFADNMRKLFNNVWNSTTPEK